VCNVFATLVFQNLHQLDSLKSAPWFLLTFCFAGELEIGAHALRMVYHCGSGLVGVACDDLSISLFDAEVSAAFEAATELGGWVGVGGERCACAE
jgi:hypothetical protein